VDFFLNQPTFFKLFFYSVLPLLFFYSVNESRTFTKNEVDVMINNYWYFCLVIAKRSWPWYFRPDFYI